MGALDISDYSMRKGWLGKSWLGEKVCGAKREIMMAFAQTGVDLGQRHSIERYLKMKALEVLGDV